MKNSDEITKLADSFDNLLKQRRKQREEEKARPKIKPLDQQIQEAKEEAAEDKDKTTNTVKQSEDSEGDVIEAIEDIVSKIESPGS